MLANILDYALLNKLNKATKRKIVESAFFTFNGLLFGILLNDIFKLLGGSQLNNTPAGFRLINHEVMQDEYYGYLISAGTGLVGIIPQLQINNKWTNNAALALGMSVGVYYANASEQGKYVGLAQVAKR